MREISKSKKGSNRKLAEQRRIDYYMRLAYSVLLHEIEDDGEKYWIAEIVELPGCKSHGSTVGEAVKNVEEAKRDWIVDGLKRGEEIPLPIERERFKGKTLLRMSRSLHRALALIAQAEGLSLNQLIVNILAKEVGQFNMLNRVESKLDELRDMLSGEPERMAMQRYIYSHLLTPSILSAADIVAYYATDDDPSYFHIKAESSDVMREDESMSSDLIFSGHKQSIGRRTL
jgi:antitoxin HicB